MARPGVFKKWLFGETEQPKTAKARMPSTESHRPLLVANQPANNRYDLMYHSKDMTKEEAHEATKRLVNSGDVDSVAALSDVRPDLVSATDISDALANSPTPKRFCLGVLMKDPHSLPKSLRDVRAGRAETAIRWSEEQDDSRSSLARTTFTLFGEPSDGELKREESKPFTCKMA